MCFFGSVVELADESVADDSDDRAVLLDSVKVLLECAAFDFFLVLGEALFLASVPVLVESSLEFFTEVLGPDGAESSEASRGVDVADKSHDLHGRGFDDSGGFDDLLFVQSGAGSVDFSKDMCHTGLEADEGGQVRLFGGVISGERSDSSSGMFGSSSWHETKVASSGTDKLSVRHLLYKSEALKTWALI